MARNRAFSKEFETKPEEEFDPEEDAMPADVLVLKRTVEVENTGRFVCLEAHITKQEDQDDGTTWIKMYEKACPEKFNHCFIDTINGELILDAIENYVRQGKGPQVATFFQEEGRSIRNPVTFRLKLDTALGSGNLQQDVDSLF